MLGRLDRYVISELLLALFAVMAVMLVVVLGGVMADTLSKIAKSELGDANAYMKIFEANRDQLSDPDKIKPGQVLKIG